MEQIPLVAQKRTILGRKVKKLRSEGLIPAHVFGHKVKTEHIQVKASEFAKVFERTGETGIIDLAVDSQKKPVLIRNVQTHPVSDLPLHIDFYQVNLAEKIKVDVSKSENVGDEIKVKDLKVDRAKVAILADEELVVTQIGELVTREMEAVEAEIEAEKAEAVAEAAPAVEGEPRPEEGAAAEEKPAEEKVTGAAEGETIAQEPSEKVPQEQKDEAKKQK